MDKKNAESKNVESNTSLTNLISTAIQLPGVKVNREFFLREQFKDRNREEIDDLLEKGPVAFGYSKDDLSRKARKLINDRTLLSTGASFAAGLPGGLAMAASIPADMLQYYGVALRLAQELAYLYGENDLWNGEILEKDRVTNQLLLYMGVMLGATGAAQTVRVLSSSLAKQALKKLPQQALTKTFFYPIIKTIVKVFTGKTLTKTVFAKGVSKAIPIVGGFVSGGITFASMRPMGNRLAQTFEEAHFDYTQQDFESDWQDIMKVGQDVEAEPAMVEVEGIIETSKPSADEVMEKIQRAKSLLDQGIITVEEFAEMKAKLIANM